MAKNIFITGATGNLGSAVTGLLSERGYQLIGTTRPGKSTKSENVDLFECDLTDEDSVANCFERIQSKYPQLHGAVLLAGGFGMGGILDSGKEDLLKMYHLNFMTAYLTSRACVKWMNESGGGQIVFTGAKPALEGGGAALLPYALSKSSVIELAELINADDQLKNIRASVIVPSVIDTPPNRESMPDANFDDWVKPTEIAENIDFLLSEKSSVLRDAVLKVYNNS